MFCHLSLLHHYYCKSLNIIHKNSYYKLRNKFTIIKMISVSLNIELFKLLDNLSYIIINKKLIILN